MNSLSKEKAAFLGGLAGKVLFLVGQSREPVFQVADKVTTDFRKSPFLSLFFLLFSRLFRFKQRGYMQGAHATLIQFVVNH